MPALQSSVKKVTVEDAVTQTDPIPGLKPLEKLKPKNTSEDQKTIVQVKHHHNQLKQIKLKKCSKTLL